MPRSGGGLLDGDPEAEPLQTPNAAPHDRIAVETVEVTRAEVVVHGAVPEHVVDDGQQGVGDGDNGPLLAPTCGDAAVESGEVGVGLPSGGPGSLHQAGPQPAGAVTGRSRAALAGSLGVGRADPGPTAAGPGGR